MRQRSTTWQSPVTLEVIQFDFGKGKGRGMHPRELKDGIFHSRFQPHRPSHCPREHSRLIPTSVPAALCLEYSSPRPSRGPGLCFLQVASAQRLPLFTLPKSAAPPQSLQPLVPFCFPPKALSPHGSMIIVVLAKQDIYQGPVIRAAEKGR